MPRLQQIPAPNSDDEVTSWGEQPAEHQTFDINALRPAPHQHNWVAQGNFVHCTVGNHGYPYDHMKQMFMGTDASGAPIFRDIDTTEADKRVRLYKKREKANNKK
jgi:hypothetical protein